MMKPDPSRKWYVKETFDNVYYAESRALGQETIHNAHCPACARLELIQRYGGWVDTRGLFLYTYCFPLLAVINRAHKFGLD